MAGQVKRWPATGYIAAIDEKAGRRPRRARPGVQGSPQLSRYCPRRHSAAQSTRVAQGEVILLERVLDRSPVAPPSGQAVVGERYPEELLDAARPCVFINRLYRSGSTMIYRNVRQKVSGCFTSSNVYYEQLLGRPQTVE